MDHSTRIAALNDRFRQTFAGGRVMLTAGVDALPPTDRTAVLDKIRSVSTFDAGDDPHGEHDFVAIEHGGKRYFGKIDYYALDLQHGSPDPGDPEQTMRVLTVMLAEEY